MSKTIGDRELHRLEIRHAIDALKDEDGIVTPDSVVEAAKDPESPLHEEFPWDKDQASYAYWLTIARRLIRQVTYVRVNGDATPTRAVQYVRSVEAGSKQQGYSDVFDIKKSVANSVAAVRLSSIVPGQ